MKPCILSLSGLTVTPDERALFRSSPPIGFILFGRNIADRAQLRALTNDLRDLIGRADLPILIDQEGGRVQRMRAPHWPSYPPPARFGALWSANPMLAIEAARANARAIGADLAEVGITVDCLPLLDVPQPGAHEAIGDRAFATDPLAVAALGRAVLDGLAEAGVVGVVKHMPGQGRAAVDSHHDLPVIDADTDTLQHDLEPFRALNDAPMGMTGHVVFTAWDADHPASTSPTVLEQVVRGAIGFDGFLMSDDLDMKALAGRPPDLARAVVEAGCDAALNCWGRLEEMAETLDRLDAVSQRSRERLARAMSGVTPLAASDAATLALRSLAQRDELIAAAG